MKLSLFLVTIVSVSCIYGMDSGFIDGQSDDQELIETCQDELFEASKSESICSWDNGNGSTTYVDAKLEIVERCDHDNTEECSFE